MSEIMRPLRAPVLRLRAFIEATEILPIHEGIRLEVYKDTEGVTTFGIGHNLEIDADKGEDLDALILAIGGLEKNDRKVVARLYFAADVNNAVDAAIRLMKANSLCAYQGSDNFHPETAPIVALALSVMCFQLGANSVRRFSRMLLALRAQQWKKAAAEALDSRWASQTPKRAAFVSSLFLQCAEKSSVE